MIPVGMGEEHAQVSLTAHFFIFHQFIAQTAQSGAGINDDDFIFIRSYFQSGGIAAISTDQRKWQGADEMLHRFFRQNICRRSVAKYCSDFLADGLMCYG